MTVVRRTGLFLAVVLVSSGAYADEAVPMDKHWPGLPHVHEVDIGDQITDHLTELGNTLGEHLDLLSHDYFKIHVDGRAQRARMRLGGGNSKYLEFKVDSDWHFAEGKARVAAHLQMAVAGHELDVQLPAMDLSTDNYHGESMVQVNVPLLERHF